MKNKKVLGLMLAGVILANIIPQVSFAAKDVDVQRIKGNNRYDTSIEISKHAFSKSDKVVVVSGEKFADALTAGNFADQAPILLTETSTSPFEVRYFFTSSPEACGRSRRSKTSITCRISIKIPFKLYLAFY